MYALQASCAVRNSSRGFLVSSCLAIATAPPLASCDVKGNTSQVPNRRTAIVVRPSVGRATRTTAPGVDNASTTTDPLYRFPDDRRASSTDKSS